MSDFQRPKQQKLHFVSYLIAFVYRRKSLK